MSKINHIPLILNDLKLHYNFKSNTDFAKFLGIAPQTLSSWYSRCSVDYDLLYAKCVDIDGNWLLSRNGKMTRGDINSEINMQEKSEANKDPEDAKQSGVNLNYYLMRFEALIRENEAHKRDKESLNVEIACIEVERDELEKELEELKAFRDKVKPTYTVGSKKVNLIASEPDPPKYTR